MEIGIVLPQNCSDTSHIAMGFLGIDACLVIAKKDHTKWSLWQRLNIGLIEFKLSTVIGFALSVLFFVYRVLCWEEN